MSFMKPFGVQNLYSLASRERCVANMKKLRVPNQWKTKVLKPNASVLVPMCTVNNVTSLLYTVRSSDLSSHGGQISFPGGKIEEGESSTQTAMRETQEEIGLSPTRIDVWGEGHPIPGKNQKYTVVPVVGTILDLKQDDLNINTKEVSEVFCVPIETLCNPSNQYYTQFRNGFILPVFVADEYKIWGITAYLTHAFLTCLLPRDLYRNEWTKKKIILRDYTMTVETN